MPLRPSRLNPPPPASSAGKKRSAWPFLFFVLLVSICCRVFYKKIQQKLIDTEVFSHVILSNFCVFAARGVPPDPHGDVKEKVKKIKTRVFNKVDLFIDFLTTLGPLWGTFREPF